MKRYPPTHLLSPRFKYTPSFATNVAHTIERAPGTTPFSV